MSIAGLPGHKVVGGFSTDARASQGRNPGNRVESGGSALHSTRSAESGPQEAGLWAARKRCESPVHTRRDSQSALATPGLFAPAGTDGGR